MSSLWSKGRLFSVERPGRRIAVALVIGAVWVGALVAGALPSDKEATAPEKVDIGGDQEAVLAVARPPFSEGIFPCSECHSPEDVVDKTRRAVDFHDTVHFDHDAENRWCLDCHDAQNRDMLRFADGRLLPFTESYKLCAQCHGTKFRDWKAGEHGRRTGSWSGEKQYLLCVHCHDPHSPKFKELTPKPPPIRQEELR